MHLKIFFSVFCLPFLCWEAPDIDIKNLLLLNEQDFGVNRWKDKRPKISWTTTLHYCYIYVDAQIKLILIAEKIEMIGCL